MRLELHSAKSSTRCSSKPSATGPVRRTGGQSEEGRCPKHASLPKTVLSIKISFVLSLQHDAITPFSGSISPSLEIIIDLPFGFPINNIISLPVLTIHLLFMCLHTCVCIHFYVVVYPSLHVSFCPSLPPSLFQSFCLCLCPTPCLFLCFSIAVLISCLSHSLSLSPQVFVSLFVVRLFSSFLLLRLLLVVLCLSPLIPILHQFHCGCAFGLLTACTTRDSDGQ